MPGYDKRRIPASLLVCFSVAVVKTNKSSILNALVGDLRALPVQVVEAWRARALLSLMVEREIRSRFTGTVLGLIWLYAQPMLTIATYYIVFDRVLKARLGEGAPTHHVGIYLIIGMVPWIGFSDGLSRAMYSLLDAAGLLQKNALPLVLFPARGALTSALTFLPPLLLVAAVFAVVRGPSPALLLLPVLILAQVALSFMLGYALAILAAAMRDVLQVIGFFLSLGIFLSPVLFTMNMIPEHFRWLFWLNPMTCIILGFQSVILLKQVPGWEVWGVLCAWLSGSALLLNRLIDRSREQLVDWL